MITVGLIILAGWAKEPANAVDIKIEDVTVFDLFLGLALCGEMANTRDSHANMVASERAKFAHNVAVEMYKIRHNKEIMK